MKIFNKNEWKKVKLGDVFDLQMGKTPLRENKLYWDRGEYHWISISDMNFSEKYISSTKEKITELAVKKSGIKIIPKNTVIMSFKLSIGKVKIVNEDIYSNEAIMAFIPKTNNFIDENFLYYSLKGVRWNEGINKAVKGLTLNKALISQKEIFLPKLAIQKEIASNLDSIADFLDLRRKQLNYLKELSKSLFTTMFGDIKTNDKNWKIYKFGDKLNISSGGTPLKTNKSYWENGTISWIGSNLCTNKTILKNDGKFITKEGLKNSSAKIYKENTIIVALVGATIGKTGLLKFQTATNQNIAALEIINNDYSPEFLFFLVQNLYYKFSELGGNTFKMANLSFVKNLPLVSPPIELQNKFAERIEKIEKLKFTIMTIILKAYETMKKRGVEKI